MITFRVHFVFLRNDRASGSRDIEAMTPDEAARKVKDIYPNIRIMKTKVVKEKINQA